jgi:hypothetical protein
MPVFQNSSFESPDSLIALYRCQTDELAIAIEEESRTNAYRERRKDGLAGQLELLESDL